MTTGEWHEADCDFCDGWDETMRRIIGRQQVGMT